MRDRNTVGLSIVDHKRSVCAGTSFTAHGLSRGKPTHKPDFKPTHPGYTKSPVSRRFGDRYVLEPPDGDGLRSGQRPQPVEVSEWDGPCPAMWAR